MKEKYDYDYIIIGSGFGGSVSAMRLSEKGYKVLVIEKGKRYRTDDFPKQNWNLPKWFWLPAVRFFGFFKLTFFRHVAILSGVGVGGGSLVYANTLPIPKKAFFNASSWSHLADWETELVAHYQTAKRMLGVARNPRKENGDIALEKLANKIGKQDKFYLTDVAVYFGEPNKATPDPFFNGEGPDREGCRFCGACMIGCRYNAKNTLDKNYLYFAERNGAEVISEKEVYDVLPFGSKGEEGYSVKWKSSTKLFKKRGEFTTRGVIFSGGVLGTVSLLLKLKRKSLPNLSDIVGEGVRTNSESLLGVTVPKKDAVFSDGIAITSILHLDDESSVEPVRYPSGSGFWRLLMFPMLDGKNWIIRLAKVVAEIIRHPVKWGKLYFVPDWAKQTQILLFMQTIDSTLRFDKGLFRMKSRVSKGKAPTAFIPEARKTAKGFAKIVGGTPAALLSETLFGIPTTAHILGGAVMGKDSSEGVIDKDNHVFGYENMFVCDGAMISANPGVNPSLTITAITERAMSKIEDKKSK